MRVPRHSLIADNEETDRLVYQGVGSTIAESKTRIRHQVIQVKLMGVGTLDENTLEQFSPARNLCKNP